MLDPDAGGANSIEDAAARLVELLDGLPAFDPCRGPIENWDPDVRQRRLPVWDLLPEHLRSLPSQVLKDSWWAYGDGMILLVSPQLRAVHHRAPGSGTLEKQSAVQRVLAAAATAVPENIRTTIFTSWRNHPTVLIREPQVILRNDWHERRSLVAGLRDDVSQLVPLAQRAITRARMDPRPVQALLEDDLLDFEVVDAAIAQLRGSMPQDAVTTAELKGNPPHLMTGEAASRLIGITPGTFSRWHKTTPAWALGNERLFKHLLDRVAGQHDRKSVMLLKKWFAAAENGSTQNQVDCP